MSASLPEGPSSLRQAWQQRAAALSMGRPGVDAERPGRKTAAAAAAEEEEEEQGKQMGFAAAVVDREGWDGR